MAQDNRGWNQLKRDKQSFMTDEFDLGDGLTFHDTIRLDSVGNIIGKPHTKFSMNEKTFRYDWSKE
jgi:hypothetical protein